jgi:hypothetical protein
VALTGEMRDTYMFWWKNLRVRDYLEELRRLEDNIKVDVKEMGLEVLDEVHVAQERSK